MRDTTNVVIRCDIDEKQVALCDKSLFQNLNWHHRKDMQMRPPSWILLWYIMKSNEFTCEKQMHAEKML